MICRFCSQWNPDGAMRCCFCTNKLDDEVDATLDGQPDYARNVQTTGPLTPVPRRGAPGGELDLLAQLKEMNKEQLVGVGLVVLGVVGLLVWLLRC